MKTKIVLSSLLFSSILLTGCAHMASAPTHTYVFKLNEQCPSGLTVAVGDTIKFVADDNPSTGYSWKLRQHLVFLDATMGYVPHKQEGYLIVGAGGVRTFNFKAKSVGQEQIHLVYTRSWMSNEVGAEWRCTVNIQ